MLEKLGKINLVV